jgi:hypothetical protein
MHSWKGQNFIGEYMERTKIWLLADVRICFSGQCYRRQMQPLSKTPHKHDTTSSTTTKRPPHSIRLVEIPWQRNTNGGIRLSVDEHQMGAPLSAAAGYRGVRISE